MLSGNEYFDKEMLKLEKQQAELRQQQEDNTRDRVNTITQQSNKHDYMRIVNADLQLAPKSGENLKDYIKKIKIFSDISYVKNWETHVDNGRKTWYTHKRPSCFMCEDQQFKSVLIQVLQVISKQNPKITF